jgi:uncharacterized protein YdhG (YjbR/CyaY superfamily)
MSPTKNQPDRTSGAKRTTASASQAFTADERAAMKERAREQKASANRQEGERELLAKITEMPHTDRLLAERVHAVVTSAAPELEPKTWYGMPAYAKKGRVVCFFQSAEKFKSRYATLGFSDQANLDDGSLWPTSFAVKQLSAAEETQIDALVRQAVSPRE